MMLIFYFHFWATFGGKKGVAKTRAPDGLGPPNPTKKLAHWVNLLGQPLNADIYLDYIVNSAKWIFTLVS